MNDLAVLDCSTQSCRGTACLGKFVVMPKAVVQAAGRQVGWNDGVLVVPGELSGRDAHYPRAVGFVFVGFVARASVTLDQVAFNRMCEDSSKGPCIQLL